MFKTDFKIGDYVVCTDKTKLKPERIKELLEQSYWANERSLKDIKTSLRHSLCYGVFIDGVQVGFSRVVTDYSTSYYLCDVIVDKDHRGKGVGKVLMEAVANDKRLKGQLGILVTRDAHGLYEKYGYVRDGDRFMIRRRT